MRTHPVIAIGDIHLYAGERNQDRRDALDQIIREALTDTVALWLYLGDIFHGDDDIPNRNWWKERVKQQLAVAPVVVLAGNHGKRGHLDIFGDMKGLWPAYVVSDLSVLSIPLATRATACVCAIPYPSRAGLVAAGASSDEQIAETAVVAYEAALQGMAMEAAARRAQGEIVLVAGHVNLVGSIASTGQPQVGREPEIAASSLDAFGPVVKVFGHIHKPQVVRDAIYAGSICRMDFGEVEAKRWLRVVLADDSAYAVEEYPIDVAPMWLVAGTLTRDGFAWETLARDGGARVDPPASWDGAEVKAKVRYDAAEHDVLDWTLVTQTFVGAKRFKLEQIAQRVRAIRAPEVAAATTLPAKVTAWCEVTRHVATPGVLRKLDRLVAPDRDEIPTEVAALVAAHTTFEMAPSPQEVLL